MLPYTRKVSTKIIYVYKEKMTTPVYFSAGAGSLSEQDKLILSQNITTFCKDSGVNCKQIKYAQVQVPFSTAAPTGNQISPDASSITNKNLSLSDITGYMIDLTGTDLLFGDDSVNGENAYIVGKENSSETNTYVDIKASFAVCEISKVNKSTGETVSSQFFHYKNIVDEEEQELLEDQMKDYCANENACVSDTHNYIVSCGLKEQENGTALKKDDIAWGAPNVLLSNYTVSSKDSSDNRQYNINDALKPSLTYTQYNTERITDSADQRLNIAQSRTEDVFVIESLQASPP